MMIRFLLYLLRWQASSPVLYVCMFLLADYGIGKATIIANLIGGAIFFWADRCIFTKDKE